MFVKLKPPYNQSAIMNNSSIYIIFTIIWAFFVYFTLKNVFPFIKTYIYLNKNGELLDGFVCSFEKNKFSRGVVPIIKYEFGENIYKSKMIHDEFSPQFFMRYKQSIKILVDVDDPSRIIASSPISILSSLFGLILIFGILIYLLVMSIVQ
jgi:hypothetical protein